MLNALFPNSIQHSSTHLYRHCLARGLLQEGGRNTHDEQTGEKDMRLFPVTMNYYRSVSETTRYDFKINE